MPDDCVCLYGTSDGDMPSFYSVATVVARVEHRCYEGQRGIWPGDKHHSVRGKWDGAVATLRFCVACWDIGQSLYCEDQGFGTMWDDIEEQLFAEGGVNGACLDKLATVEGKQYLAERWWEWLQDKRRLPIKSVRAVGISGAGLW